jgi:steroid 5-alpha reductase family enzyme
MIKTTIILILTLIIVPIVSFYFGDPLTPLQTQILFNCGFICAAVAFTCFIISELTCNNSQVDKIWSIVPMVYAWYIAYAGGMNDRLILMAVLVSIWGIRLTYNFSRRGAYTWKFWAGEEDYRWKVLREKPELKGRTRWFLFNLFFISIYQNVLILLFTLPVLLAVQEIPTPLGWLDFVSAAAFVGFVIIETVADQQQWKYQQEKHKKIKAGESLNEFYKKGFTHSGLWKYMRHPNYMSEQAVWICFYFLSVAATGQWINWSVAGCLLLVILFQGSSDFSEGISMSKYAGYSEYKKKTGRFIPKFWL